MGISSSKSKTKPTTQAIWEPQRQQVEDMYGNMRGTQALVNQYTNQYIPGALNATAGMMTPGADPYAQLRQQQMAQAQMDPQAQQALGGAMQGGPGMNRFTAGAIGMGMGAGDQYAQQTQQSLGRLMNPQGPNPQLQAYGNQLSRQFQNQIMPQIGQAANQANSLGGSRQGIAESQAAGNVYRQLQDFAGQQYQGDMNRALQAAQTGGNLGMQGRQNALQAGNMMGNWQQQAQQRALEAAGMQNQFGLQQGAQGLQSAQLSGQWEHQNQQRALEAQRQMGQMGADMYAPYLAQSQIYGSPTVLTSGGGSKSKGKGFSL